MESMAFVQTCEVFVFKKGNQNKMDGVKLLKHKTGRMHFVDSAEQNVCLGNQPVAYIMMLKAKAWHPRLVTERFEITRPRKPSVRWVQFSTLSPLTRWMGRRCGSSCGPNSTHLRGFPSPLSHELSECYTSCSYFMGFSSQLLPYTSSGPWCPTVRGPVSSFLLL